MAVVTKSDVLEQISKFGNGDEVLELLANVTDSWQDNVDSTNDELEKMKIEIENLKQSNEKIRQDYINRFLGKDIDGNSLSDNTSKDSRHVNDNGVIDVKEIFKNE